MIYATTKNTLTNVTNDTVKIPYLQAYALII